MLAKLQPEGDIPSQASRGGAGDNDPTTSSLQEAMERLHGQHLSGTGEGVQAASFMTPAGARGPQGRSPPNEVSYDKGCLGLHMLQTLALCELLRSLLASCETSNLIRCFIRLDWAPLHSVLMTLLQHK